MKFKSGDRVRDFTGHVGTVEMALPSGAVRVLRDIDNRIWTVDARSIYPDRVDPPDTPLPAALTAEDAGVLEAAGAYVRGTGTPNQYMALADAVQRRTDAQRAVPQDSPWQAPDTLHADLDDPAADAVDDADERARCVVTRERRIVTAAMAWRKTLPTLPSTAYEGVFGVFVREVEELMAMAEPADPDKELREAAKAVLAGIGPRDQRIGGTREVSQWELQRLSAALAAMERG